MTHICEKLPRPRPLSQGERGETGRPQSRGWERGECTDGRLLERFIQNRDESAFAEIVRRHGVMVLGVCQRVLDNRHDAEDCFQAAFMVLCRKATTIHPRDMVGNWLYGVAYRTALEARKLAARRRTHEKKRSVMPQPDSDAELWQEMRPLLDQELSKLPDKYRFVLIQCDLEGKTRSEVAELLDVPEGTVASRLARARSMLAKRLQRHRVLVSPLMLASLVAEQTVTTSLSDSLVANTSRIAKSKPASSVVRIADAVLLGMFWTKLKIAGALVCLAALFGLGVVAFLPSANAERKADVGKFAEKPRRIKECILRKVDPQKPDLEISRLDAEHAAADVVLRVDPEATVLIAGKQVKLTDLKVDMILSIDVREGADGALHAMRIEVVGHAISGLVRSIDRGKLTLQADDQQLPAEAITIDPQANVTIKGAKAKVEDLAKGTRVTLQVTEPRDRIIAITSPPLGRP